MYVHIAIESVFGISIIMVGVHFFPFKVLVYSWSKRINCLSCLVDHAGSLNRVNLTHWHARAVHTKSPSNLGSTWNRFQAESKSYFHTNADNAKAKRM